MTHSILFSILLLLVSFNAEAQEKADSSTRKSTVFPFQLSIFPPLSTNGIENENSVNECSINLFAGYSGGVNGLELGAFANVVKGDIQGLQMAGFVNIAGGETRGGQLAGFCNVNQNNVSGVQMAGFTNVVNDSVNGTQLAGFCNLNTGTTNGWQGAGFLNLSRENFSGLQVAGFVNVVSDTFQGSQFSGFSNVVTGETRGVQYAGFSNTTVGDLHGVQVAGFINTADSVSGIQISGFMNIARSLRGVQLGFINYADSLVSGTPVGFLSFVRKGGYHVFEITGNETFYAGIQVKTGSDRFYTLFNAGVRPGTDFNWGFGYGLGTCLKNTGKFRVNFDLFSMHVSENTIWTNHLNLLNKAQAGLTWQISKRVGFTAGPTFNVLITNKNNQELSGIEKTVAPETPSFDQVYSGNTRVQMWPGIHAAFRF